jgi:hypothetical protein
LLEAQFGSVLDGHDALVLRDVRRQGVQQGGLAGASSAADEDVEARPDASLKPVQHTDRHGLLGHQILTL